MIEECPFQHHHHCFPEYYDASPKNEPPAGKKQARTHTHRDYCFSVNGFARPHPLQPRSEPLLVRSDSKYFVQTVDQSMPVLSLFHVSSTKNTSKAIKVKEIREIPNCKTISSIHRRNSNKSPFPLCFRTSGPPITSDPPNPFLSWVDCLGLRVLGFRDLAPVEDSFLLSKAFF